MVGHCRDTLQLGTAGIRGGWALQGYSAVRHRRDALRLGTAGILGGWALQGYSAVQHCRDTRRFGTAGILGHCRDTWWLGTAGILGGWSLKSASSRVRTTSTLKSNNPTARVGNNDIVVLLGFHWGVIGVLLGLNRGYIGDNGRENGSYYYDTSLEKTLNVWGVRVEATQTLDPNVFRRASQYNTHCLPAMMPAAISTSTTTW